MGHGRGSGGLGEQVMDVADDEAGGIRGHGGSPKVLVVTSEGG